MAPPTKETLELREGVDNVNRRIDEMIEGFRNLANKNKQLLEFFQAMKQELEGVKVDIANMKAAAANNQNYTSKVTRF